MHGLSPTLRDLILAKTYVASTNNNLIRPRQTALHEV